MPEMLDIPLRRITGQSDTLRAHTGKVLLIVNVASQCGLTPQYAGLQALQEARCADGMEVLAFPANDFGAQEPGTHEEIASFCHSQFAVDFPLFEKISVAGPQCHPLYTALLAAQPVAHGGDKLRETLVQYGMRVAAPHEVLWNFEKFVLDRSGRVVGRFAPDTAPDDPALLACIDNALRKT